MPFHVTEAQFVGTMIAGAVAYGLYLLQAIRAELSVIRYNTGRTSENLSELRDYLYRRDTHQQL